jgi:hypothetical protein
VRTCGSKKGPEGPLEKLVVKLKMLEWESEKFGQIIMEIMEK